MNNKKDSNILEILASDIFRLNSEFKLVKDKVENFDFSDDNYVKCYSIFSQLKVLKKVYRKLSQLNDIDENLAQEIDGFIENLSSNLESYDFDDLELCPKAESLKIKYKNYLNAQSSNKSL